MPRTVSRHAGRSGTSGQVAIAAIIALGAACLAGSPLYLSSVATAAVQSELGYTCLADVGLRIPVGGAQPDTIPILQAMAEPLAEHTQPSVLTRIAPSTQVDTGATDSRSGGGSFDRRGRGAGPCWLGGSLPTADN